MLVLAKDLEPVKIVHLVLQRLTRIVNMVQLAEIVILAHVLEALQDRLVAPAVGQLPARAYRALFPQKFQTLTVQDVYVKVDSLAVLVVHAI